MKTFPREYFHWPVEQDLSFEAMTAVKLAVIGHLARACPANEHTVEELQNLVNVLEAVEQKRAAKVPGWEPREATEEWLDS